MRRAGWLSILQNMFYAVRLRSDPRLRRERDALQRAMQDERPDHEMTA